MKDHVRHKEAERKICDEHPDACMEVLLQDSECFVGRFDYLLESCVEKLSAKGRIELCWHYFNSGALSDEKARTILGILDGIPQELHEVLSQELQTNRYQMLHSLSAQLASSDPEKTQRYAIEYCKRIGFFFSGDESNGEKEPESKRAKSHPRSPG